MTNTLDCFHPAVAAWFRKRFGIATDPQRGAWPAIASGRHTLIAAPTGSGKTLAAFLWAIDALVREGLKGHLPDETKVLYVSPLKALSNDVQHNLEAPLAGITDELLAMGRPAPEIRTLVRTGDTPRNERAAMRRRPPHVLVTTPESLYILLTSDSGRDMLRTVGTVIVDEIHAVAATKRGAHLTLSLERLEALTEGPLIRIGLSATQKPLSRMGGFLTGQDPRRPPCALVDIGYRQQRDLALELPPSPLEAVMAGEVWEEVYDRLTALIEDHRTTLIFVNTRRMAERVTRHLSERLGEELVTSHHGSLSRRHRLAAEQRLKQGQLRALVATASLELGIDIGDVDLVCQLGSPNAIATFLQRAGRSGHAVGGVPRGRLFPLSRDELVECAALLEAVQRGELDELHPPAAPLDVLAQQIVAETACREWREEDLYRLVRRADTYRELSRAAFTGVVRMLADGFDTQRGRRGAYLYRDAVNGRLRGRRGARLAAVMGGGTIPDNADYQVVLEPEGHVVGTLNEDFAIESMAGDIFQLGNSSYRILRVESGRVRVEDAHGQPPTIPFWLGEAPARSDELSAAVARLREDAVGRGDAAAARLMQIDGVGRAAALQAADYLRAAEAALGAVPTQRTVVLERFFDESGGMQLVIHAPFGSRINRAWGLALRKRFCRRFNFELQAAATEDAIVLSLSTSHSFPLEEVARYLNSRNVREVLIQALLDAPMFTTRWRWNASVALAVPRFRAGRRVAAPLQRMIAEDLLAVAFPDQVACLENITGDREIPDHPLVQQTLHDCLTEAMDIAGLERLLAAMETGQVTVLARDLPQPSPLAQEILTARPYTFLDDAPLEERRTQAVINRRWSAPGDASELGRLDPEAIERVRREAWPEAEDRDELHDALIVLGCLTEREGTADSRWRPWLEELIGEGRATVICTDGVRLWAAAERLPQLRQVYPKATLAPPVDPPAEFAAQEWAPEPALVEILRSRLEGLGPQTIGDLAGSLGLTPCSVEAALCALEAEGFVLRGRFTAALQDGEWCERRLLARIHHYTVKRLRREIEPVAAADFMRFVFRWQRALPDQRGDGPQALAKIIEQLEGFEAPATAWEHDILPLRLVQYAPEWLDGLCLSGRILWLRRSPPRTGARERGIGPVKGTPVSFLQRASAHLWRRAGGPDEHGLSPRARLLADHLRGHGALFFDELTAASGLLPSQVQDTLGELVAWGLVSADAFSGLRTLLRPAQRRTRGRRSGAARAMEETGRWALVKDPVRAQAEDESAPVHHIAMALLRRYGVVFRKLLQREGAGLPPWRDLLAVYRRWEARGEIRGGRFVAGFTGEQFALPEAVGPLRSARDAPPRGILIGIAAADPLNLTGIVTPGARVPATAGNRILYEDGLPVAALSGGEVSFLAPVAADRQWHLHNAVLRCNAPQTARPGTGEADRAAG